MTTPSPAGHRAAHGNSQYSTRLVVDTGAELAEVTREGGKSLDEDDTYRSADDLCHPR